MQLDQTKIKLLLDVLALTQDEEIDCDACFDSMAEFAESQLTGISVPDALLAIDHHIRICADCAEEFAILKKTIADMEDDLNQNRRKMS